MRNYGMCPILTLGVTLIANIWWPPPCQRNSALRRTHCEPVKAPYSSRIVLYHTGPSAATLGEAISPPKRGLPQGCVPCNGIFMLGIPRRETRGPRPIHYLRITLALPHVS
jgi:hypothetical protein